MLEQKTINKLRRHLKNLLPIPENKIIVEYSRSKQYDVVAQIDYQGLRFDLVIEVVSSSSFPLMQNKINRLKSSVFKENEIPVLAAPYLSPEKQKLCRNSSINFIDLSGNVFLAYSSFYIERVGFPNKFPEKRKRRSPFSDKASLILRELMINCQRQWGIRELAQKIDLNAGYVSRMASSLEDDGYVSRANRKMRIRSPREILRDWVRVYDLKKNNLNRFFCLAPNVESIIKRFQSLQIPKKIKYAFGVQAGAALVSPHAVYKEIHIYVKNKNGIDFFKHALDLKESEQGSNIVLMLPHYKHSVFYDNQIKKGLNVVSNIQLYIDLFGYPVRGHEQAEYLYDRKLKAAFGEQR
jgi:hypothetical protein